MTFDGDHCRLLFSQEIIAVLQAFGGSMQWLCSTERHCMVCMLPVP